MHRLIQSESAQCRTLQTESYLTGGFVWSHRWPQLSRVKKTKSRRRDDIWAAAVIWNTSLAGSVQFSRCQLCLRMLLLRLWMVWRAPFPVFTLLCCLQAQRWCLSVACLFHPHWIVTLLRNAIRQKFDSLSKILALNEGFLNSEPTNAVYM